MGEFKVSQEQRRIFQTLEKLLPRRNGLCHVTSEKAIAFEHILVSLTDSAAAIAEFTI